MLKEKLIMENQKIHENPLMTGSPETHFEDGKDSISQILWEADIFQITPEGMELVQKVGAEKLTL